MHIPISGVQTNSTLVFYDFVFQQIKNNVFIHFIDAAIPIYIFYDDINGFTFDVAA